jgi:hypothetical protein
VTAYRAALKELTRERVLLQWAATQDNPATRSGAWRARRDGTI